MDFQEFKLMVNSIRDVEKALGNVKYNLSERVQKNRIFSRSLFVVQDIKKGEKITSNNVRSIRPGYGISPKYLKQILGKIAIVDIKRGTPLEWRMIDDK